MSLIWFLERRGMKYDDDWLDDFESGSEREAMQENFNTVVEHSIEGWVILRAS